MYLALSIGAAVIALLVLGFGVFAAYLAFSGKRDMYRAALRRWTAFDYLVLFVYLVGMLFLLSDLIGVMRDREAYPFYHYGYLLSGFVYTLLSGILLFVRLGMTFRLSIGEEAPYESAEAPGAYHDRREPEQAEAAEERV